MPGLSQLKKFNSDMLNLGDEVKIRSTRGEKPVTVAIPKDIADVNDSEDFRNGMPQLSEEEQEQADAAAREREREENDFSDITGVDDEEEDSKEEKKSKAKAPDTPDVSDLLMPGDDLSLDDLDLSDFETPEPPPEPEKPEEIPIEDLDLEALLAPKSEPEPEPENEIEEEQEPEPFIPQMEDVNPLSMFAPEPEKEKSQPEKEEPPVQTQASDNGLDEISDFKMEEPEVTEASSLDEPSFEAESLDSESLASEPLEAEAGTTTEDTFDLPDFDAPEVTEASSLTEPSFEAEPLASEPLEAEAGTTTEDTFDLPDFDAPEVTEASSLDEPSFETESLASEPLEAEAGTTTEDTFDLPDFDAPEVTEASDLGDMSLEPTDNLEGMDSLEDLDAAPSAPEADMSVPEEEPFETFDTSAMDGLDFSGGGDPFGDAGSDFELGTITGIEGDDNDLFNIPGFSDTTTADINKKPNVQSPDFSGAIEGDEKPKNTFTDAEYKRFRQNLELYPLNVRIALEDLVVKNEFTDDAVFAVLEKVLRKVPARQLASELEKMLDIQLDVPRDFERRSATEYEAYKKSFEYQLKNKILPGAILTTIAALVIVGIMSFSIHFIYNPLHANHLYKQGYALIQEEQYPQSEDLFNQALIYKQSKPWFFKYAQGYREKKQYDRSRMMYKAVINRYKHDKQAGMEWAEMEMHDLFNYEEAERILVKEVLDYHVHDPDAVLLLGDLYLEWATERDSTKFAKAKERYDELLQLYGGTSNQNLYLSRQMRYYIRTDNLRQVLQYKELFYPMKKGLDADDLTELSGYLLDKRYGSLRPSEESLRFSIENVRELLERALKANSENPVALYNMGRYFVEANNSKGAISNLKRAINNFEKQNIRNHRDTYRYINSYRMLGEEYIEGKEFITAEEYLAKGIEIYENANKESGFESDANVGHTYADLADIDYFRSNDLDRALSNYINAVNNKYDNSSVRYRIGFIQYSKQNYRDALGSFIKSQETNGNDTHLLLALANTLSTNNDNYVAKGYYERLLNILDVEKERYGVILPQVRNDHEDIVSTYMKASNNLGVTLYRLGKSTGNSSLNSQAIVYMQDSLRAWDALSRNQETMIRLDGTNLAEQNIKYITRPNASYEPSIYNEIPRILSNEKVLE